MTNQQPYTIALWDSASGNYRLTDSKIMTPSKESKYNLGGVLFTSKDAIKKHVQSIFKSYNDGETLSDRDFQLVLDLLEWHPSASRKIGCGIAEVKIHIPKPWTTKGFLLVRSDGSSCGFSYKVCLNPRLADQSVRFLEACRSAIIPQVSQFKKDTFGDGDRVWCEVSESWISWDEAHVDHYPRPFIDLVEEYTTSSGIEVKSLAFTGDKDDEYNTRFADPRIERDWQNWHKQNTALRVIKGSENIKLGAHGRVSA